MNVNGISKRLCLIYPASDFDIEHHKDALPNGLLSLAAVVEQVSQHAVDVFDARNTKAMPDDPSRYDVIGFTSMSMQIKHALHLVARVREQGFRGKIIFGGPHASVTPEHLMANADIDAVFIGEAEISLLKYLAFLEGLPEQLERVWVRDKQGQWQFHEGSTYIPDLDILPLPAREKFAHVIKRNKFINIFTARGCPFNCKFCQPTKRILFGNKVRRRSIDHIIAEIDDAINKYGITGFSIDDDTFTYNKKLLIEFCHKIKQYKLSWSCQTRCDIDEETLLIMKGAGCRLVFIGAESGSQRVLDLMDKNIQVASNYDFVKRCNRLGIKTWCNIILGYPGETLEDMQQTHKFIEEAKPTRACVSQATPFPGTYLFDEHKEDIIPMDWDAMARHVHQPKFNSMKHLQPYIQHYVKVCSVGWDQPL